MTEEKNELLENTISLERENAELELQNAELQTELKRSKITKDILVLAMAAGTIATLFSVIPAIFHIYKISCGMDILVENAKNASVNDLLTK